MSKPVLRRVKRLAVALTIVGGAVVLLHALLLRWVHHTLRERINAAAAASGSAWIEPDGSTLSVSLLTGDIRIVDLKWERRGEPQGSVPALSGTLDSLVVQGLSYHHLFMDGVVDMDRLMIHGTDLDVQLSTDTATRSKDSQFHGLRAAELNIVLLRSAVLLPESISVGSQEFKLEGRSFEFGDTVVRAEALEALLVGSLVSPFADSTLSVQRITLSERGTRITIDGIDFGPVDVRHLAERVTLERDVIAGTVGRITMSGIDLGSCRRGVARARSIRISSADLQVARDKHRPDPPFKHKPLPARLLRALPLNTGFDSVLVDGMDVSYFERVEPLRGYAHIPFDSIAAVVQNLRHVPGDTLLVRATARAFDRTPVQLELRGAVGDTTDRIMVEAMVGDLRFARLNDVLAPLTGVATPEGRLDTLILRMTGDDARATAKCWMRYDGLRVDRRGGKENVLDPVLNSIMNAVVKGGRTGEKDGEGWKSYSWDRRQDRSLFNFLWAGVREGAKQSMLPQVVLDRTTKR